MPDRHEAEMSAELTSVLEGLWAIHALEAFRDNPDVATVTAVEKAADMLRRLNANLDAQKSLAKAAVDHANAYRGLILHVMDKDPAFKASKLSAHIRILSIVPDRIWSAVRRFQDAVEKERLTHENPAAKRMLELVMSIFAHDLAGVMGMSLRNDVRQALAAAAGVPDPEEPASA